MEKDKRRKRNKNKREIKQNKEKVKAIKTEVKENRKDKKHNKDKVIEVNVGFTVLKIIAIILIISLITAQTVRTIIGTKENISETEQEGIALLAEIDIEYILSDDEIYVTVTITSDYVITQIEVSEEDYDENLEEGDYTFTIEEDWEITEEGLILTKEFTENIDKAYRLTFEDETSVVEEVIIEDFLDSEEDGDEKEENDTKTENSDENGSEEEDNVTSYDGVSFATEETENGVATVASSYTTVCEYDITYYSTYDGSVIANVANSWTYSTTMINGYCIRTYDRILPRRTRDL